MQKIVQVRLKIMGFYLSLTLTILLPLLVFELFKKTEFPCVLFLSEYLSSFSKQLYNTFIASYLDFDISISIHHHQLICSYEHPIEFLYFQTNHKNSYHRCIKILCL